MTELTWHTSGWPELDKPVILAFKMGQDASRVIVAAFEDTREGVLPVFLEGGAVGFSKNTLYAWALMPDPPKELGRWGDNPMHGEESETWKGRDGNA
jgi:hypothetical protein